MRGTLALRNSQCSSLEGAVARAEADKKAAETRLKEAEAETRRAFEEKALAESAEKASQAEASSQARRVSDLESELAILRADLETEVIAKANLQAEVAEAKVGSTKKQMELNEALSKSAKQNSLLQSLSDRLVAVERGVEAAKVEAVEAFKDSQAFADAVAECSADSYRLGFADCKEATVRLFPDLDISGVSLPSDDAPEEEEGEGEGAAGGDVAGPTETLVEVVEVEEAGDLGESAPAAPASAGAEEEGDGG